MVVLIVASVIAAGYIGTSVFLLKFPEILHKKKRLAFNHCFHISHRGGAGENLENTITAFEHAIQKCKSNMLELDCQLTKDGQVVVAHDDHLGRICGLGQRIKDLNFKDLPPIRSTLKLDFDREISVTVDPVSDRRIPLLREIFDAFPSTPINLDVKTKDPELLEQVATLIESYDREAITPWGNWQNEISKSCYARNPDIPLIFSLRRCAHLLLLFYSGLLPFVPLKESCLELAMPSIFYERLHHAIQPNRPLKLFLMVMNRLLMSRTLFHHLRARGIHVYVWVLNEEREYKRAFDLGASGVMTDFPTKLRRYLDENTVVVQEKGEDFIRHVQ